MTSTTRTNNSHIEKTGHANCHTCSLRNKMLFASLKDEELDLIAGPITQLRIPPQQLVYSQESKGTFVYTIRSGLIKLTQYSENGTPRIVRLLHPGDVAGLELMIDNVYRHTAETLTETHVCRIPLHTLQDTTKLCSSIYDGLMQRMQDSLDSADDVIVQFSTGTAQARVARLLLLAKEKNQPEMCLNLTRKEIASLLGLTVETVSRVFAEFKRQSLLEENDNVLVIDQQALQTIVNKID